MNIYRITNALNGKQYIGYTKKSIKRRFREHVCAARNLSAYQLHQAIRKHGEENFSIELLENVTEETSTIREQFWIEECGTFKNGYNMTLGGDGTYGVKKDNSGSKNPMFGRKQSAESNEKNRQSNLEYVRKFGSRKQSLETRQKISEGNSKKWVLVDPAGNQFEVTNLWQYCKENNLNASHLSAVASGKLKQHKGYKCYAAN